MCDENTHIYYQVNCVYDEILKVKQKINFFESAYMKSIKPGFQSLSNSSLESASYILREIDKKNNETMETIESFRETFSGLAQNWTQLIFTQTLKNDYLRSNQDNNNNTVLSMAILTLVMIFIVLSVVLTLRSLDSLRFRKELKRLEDMLVTQAGISQNSNSISIFFILIDIITF